jgi:hypothetical protein
MYVFQKNYIATFLSKFEELSGYNLEMLSRFRRKEETSYE